MSIANDVKIKEVLQTIEALKAKMGVRPRATWKTNAMIDGQNLNTISSIETCILITADLMGKNDALEAACQFLGLDSKVTAEAKADNEDCLEDLKLKVQILKWDEEKKKLSAKERQLKDLRSEDLKTADALEELTKDLG